jgi:centromeric protein E
MRPLNTKESDGASVWRVLKKHNVIAQTTTDGKPLTDRSEGRNVFAFDKTFGTSSKTRDVYDGVVKNIVTSVVGGLNGTVFAYGQTSSGKTHTFFGGGTSDASSQGIIQMAANDVFAHVATDATRNYVLKTSFIEIYNEEVRDLLVCGNDGMGAPLAVREDPRRGVFVNANETMVSGLETLMGTLMDGERNRSVGSTAMNERSSRSHTIFRITVESRKRKATHGTDGEGGPSLEPIDEELEDFEKPDEEDEAVQVSTLNLVDLAGSESVRHTGATGERQKEGGKINQR